MAATVMRAIVVIALVCAAAPASSVGAGSLRPVQTYVVGWDDGASREQRLQVHSQTGAEVKGEIPELGVERIDLAPSMLASYRASPLVGFIEPLHARRIFDAPSDPLLDHQWPLDVLRVRRGWRIETGARHPVTVAIVDTGIDAAHPDLAGRLVPGIDLVSMDDDPHDDLGHGTHVAGVIAANTDNRTGIAGMSWGAKVMPIRACGESGACDGFTVAAAVVHAVVSGADVVNLSLGGPSSACPELEALAASYASEQGVLLVAATGNSAQGGNPVNYPAACPGYLGVGATDGSDRIASFSSYGDYVDVTAPGVGVMSTLPPALSGDSPFPGYGAADGTSMAAPHVSALAALLLSQDPDRSPEQIERRIERSAVDLGPKGRDDRYGAGRIDVMAALARR